VSEIVLHIRPDDLDLIKYGIVNSDLKVTKGNSLIQRSIYTMNIIEHRIVLFLIAKVNPWDDELLSYQFDINQFCTICGLDSRGGKTYARIRDALKNLYEQSFWVQLEDGRKTLVKWISRPFIDEKHGYFDIRLDELMRPYLLDLKGKFTSYSLVYTLAMRSTYSIRLYELLKSYENMGAFTIDIETLKEKIGAMNYQRYADFKKRALIPALNEISMLTDLTVSWVESKKGNRVVAVLFRVGLKSPLELDKVHTTVGERLRRASLDDIPLLADQQVDC
jgi:Protein involved in initiation of plasmid replication